MYLVTGVTGFIGFHIASALFGEGKQVIGLNIVEKDGAEWIRQARLEKLSAQKAFTFLPCDVTDNQQLKACLQPFAKKITHVIHLAAQTGVHDSQLRPHSCAQRNILGQLHMLEQFRTFENGRHFIYASSSSVYGANSSAPFKETGNTDHPLSIYAATKKVAELMAESYARLYPMHITGLRFFTVYGPWGRPDMAYFSFARNITAGKPLILYNEGNMRRDFTFIDDIVAGVMAVAEQPRTGSASHKIYNLGNGNSEPLGALVQYLEEALGKKAVCQHAPLRSGEMIETWADISAARADFAFSPKIRLQEGIQRFVEWYKEYAI